MVLPCPVCNAQKLRSHSCCASRMLAYYREPQLVPLVLMLELVLVLLAMLPAEERKAAALVLVSLPVAL